MSQTTYAVIESQNVDLSLVSFPPEGKLFRNAWATPVGGVIQTDLTLAKAIKKKMLDKERQAMMDQLDLEYVIADETRNAAGNSLGVNIAKNAIAAKKQALRDYPQSAAFVNVASVADLAALTLQDVAPDAFD